MVLKIEEVVSEGEGKLFICKICISFRLTLAASAAAWQKLDFEVLKVK